MELDTDTSEDDEIDENDLVNDDELDDMDLDSFNNDQCLLCEEFGKDGEIWFCRCVRCGSDPPLQIDEFRIKENESANEHTAFDLVLILHQYSKERYHVTIKSETGICIEIQFTQKYQ
ncbi:hypothetical protein FQR65_LT10040 [Abscondita terminalis]|nr:hypothetical protein FQR65_LT10040 [Abscondita terminalis]